MTIMEAREKRPSFAYSIAAQLRVHQWVKNLLLVVPITMAHQLRHTGALITLAAAFGSFCTAASAGYVINDLADLEHDRLHTRKRTRPLASGALPIGAAHALW